MDGLRESVAKARASREENSEADVHELQKPRKKAAAKKTAKAPAKKTAAKRAAGWKPKRSA